MGKSIFMIYEKHGKLTVSFVSRLSYEDSKKLSITKLIYCVTQKKALKFPSLISFSIKIDK